LADQLRGVTAAMPCSGRIHVDVSPVSADDLKALLKTVEGDANGIVKDGRRLEVDRLCHLKRARQHYSVNSQRPTPNNFQWLTPAELDHLEVAGRQAAERGIEFVVVPAAVHCAADIHV